MPRIAVIGCGNRVTNMLQVLVRTHPDAVITAICDPDEDQVRTRLQAADIPQESVVFYPQVDELLATADRLDGLAIGTRCHLHAPLAAQVARARLPLFLEKPVATSFEQLQELRDAWAGREDEVVVSFPLRVTPVFGVVQEYLADGRTGPVNQIQAVNNVPYADCYYGAWYRRFAETGGLWLQKATHDFDYLNHLVGARPLRVAAMMTQRVFGTGRVLEPNRCGDERYELPDRDDEDIQDASARIVHDRGSRFHAAIRNQDAGSAIIWYENGVVVSYDQNFVSRRSAGRRGAIITGYNGTIEWDWDPPEHMRFVDHHSNRVDRLECPAAGGHGGGDAVLSAAFYKLMTGAAKSAVNLTAGLQSVAMCLAAREAARTHTVQPIEDMGLFAACEPFELARVEHAGD